MTPERLAEWAKKDCHCCGLPMHYGPSMGGDTLCGWCDSGVWRNGNKWTPDDTVFMIARPELFGRSAPTLGQRRARASTHAPSP